MGNILGNPNLSLLLNCERGVLNVLEVHGITALMNIHRWTNKKITLYFLTLENDNWFNFYFVLVSLNKKIASLEQRNSRLYTLRETREGLGTWPRAHPRSAGALKNGYFK